MSNIASDSTIRRFTPSPRRRWAKRLVLAIVLGPLITAAIAWAGAAIGSVDRVRIRTSGGLGYQDDRIIADAGQMWSILGTRLMWVWHSDLQPEESLTAELRQYRDVVLRQGPAPRWSRLRRWPTNNHGVSEAFKSAHPTVARFEDGWGWPLRCLTVVYGFDTTRALMVPAVEKSGVEVPLRRASGRRTALALPLLPYWPGLIINSAFWAVVALLLVSSWSTIRTWQRRRIGRCIECGYDLRGQQRDGTSAPRCPECGCAFGAPSAAV